MRNVRQRRLPAVCRLPGPLKGHTKNSEPQIWVHIRRISLLDALYNLLHRPADRAMTWAKCFRFWEPSRVSQPVLFSSFFLVFVFMFFCLFLFILFLLLFLFFFPFFHLSPLFSFSSRYLSYFFKILKNLPLFKNVHKYKKYTGI